MSWLFSRALVEAFSEGNSWDGEPSVPLSVMPTPHPFWWRDKTTDFCTRSPFGVTFKPLTEDRGAAVLMWCQAASRARTSALQEKAQASPELAPACGPTWRASFARFDPLTSLWRTAQLSLLADSELSSVTWPRSGMTAGGQCWELPTLGRRISETGFGSEPNGRDFFHTPTGGGLDGGSNSRTALAKRQAAHIPTPTVNGNYNRIGASPTSGEGLATWVKKWPTPCATDARPITGGNLYQTSTGSVRHMRPDGKSSNRGLEASVKWATPKARDWKAGGVGMRNSPDLPTQVGGTLNPTWVKWLMGWPLGWTDLRPLETDKFRQWQQQHGASLPTTNDATLAARAQPQEPI